MVDTPSSPTDTSDARRPTRAAALPAEERRAAIIAATEPLLAEIGQQVTTRAIAEAAGVAEGTIFRVFADKDDLISATYLAVLERSTVEAAMSQMDPDAPFVDRLTVAVEAVRDKVLYVWRLHANLSPTQRLHQPRPLQASPALVDLMTKEAHRFRVTPHEAARLLLAVTLATTHPGLSPEPLPPEAIVRLFLEGVGIR